MDVVLKALTGLIERAAAFERCGRQPDAECARAVAAWVLDAHHLLARLGLHVHATWFQGLAAPQEVLEKLPRLRGALQSAKGIVEAGLLDTMQHLLRRALYGEIIARAETLHGAGQAGAAAALAAVVIEGWLRDRAEREGLAGARSKDAATLVTELRRSGALTKLEWQQAHAGLSLGQVAASGADVAPEAVRAVLDFARAHCTPVAGE